MFYLGADSLRAGFKEKGFSHYPLFPLMPMEPLPVSNAGTVYRFLPNAYWAWANWVVFFYAVFDEVPIHQNHF
jgi:hypothetical protein